VKVRSDAAPASVRPGGALFVSLVLALAMWSDTAHAVVIEGVDFSDFLLFSLPSGDLTLSTSQDVYVYAPDTIVANTLDLSAAVDIFVAQSITAGTLSLCAPSCASGPFTFDQDLVVALSGPIGELTVLAGGSIVVASEVVPEPASALLVGPGLVGIAARRVRRGGG
jgi:hypothetical protein